MVSYINDAKLKLISLMDKQVVPSNIGEYPIGIFSRSHAKEIPLLLEGWEEDNDILRQLTSILDVKTTRKVIDDINLDDKNYLVNNFSAIDKTDDESDDVLIEIKETDEAHTKIKNSKKQKQPLQKFNENGLVLLSENSRQLLDKNNQMIFHNGLNYSEQIEATIQLLNPNGEKKYNWETFWRKQRNSFQFT